MNTNRSETVLSDEALDHVVGGINPQALPPRAPNPEKIRQIQSFRGAFRI